MVGRMDDAQVGRVIKAIRRKKGLRQSEVAAAADVGQQTVSDLENGRIDSLDCIRRVCRALGASLSLHVEWRGGSFDRLVDALHARLVEQTAALLRASGWVPILEFSFNHYGDRGSVDILAWHPVFQTLLIIEVKTSIRNVGELFRRLDVKLRVVPRQAAEANGWNVRHVAVLLVVPGTTSLRRSVHLHEDSFAAALPARTVEIKQWLRHPDRPIRGVAFVRNTGAGGTAFRETSGSSRRRQPSERNRRE
jgi:transcriptional regulator with XRE-family HTH domain